MKFELLNTLSNLKIMYERSELQKITERIKEPRRFIQVLMGPRLVKLR